MFCLSCFLIILVPQISKLIRFLRQHKRFTFSVSVNHRHSQDRVNVGENIWAAPYSNYTEAVAQWFNEVYDSSCDCKHAYKHCCGHYVQVFFFKYFVGPHELQQHIVSYKATFLRIHVTHPSLPAVH